MPKYRNGHNVELEVVCNQCGSEVSFYGELAVFSSIGDIALPLEEVSIISSRIPHFSEHGFYSASVSEGDNYAISENTFTAKRISGGTWLDYLKEYKELFEKWVRLIMADKASETILALDTRNPLSVLVLKTFTKINNVIVLAIAADEESTPLEQNSSYVCIELIKRRSLPTLYVTENYLRDMAYFSETEGLLVGRDALLMFIRFLLKNVRESTSFLRRDARLGITDHVFSTVMGVSAYVFDEPGNALEVVRLISSCGETESQPSSLYMIFSSPQKYKDELINRFERQVKAEKNLLVIDISFFESKDEFMTILLMQGVTQLGLQKRLEKGYEYVKKSAYYLSVESVD